MYIRISLIVLVGFLDMQDFTIMTDVQLVEAVEEIQRLFNLKIFSLPQYIKRHYTKLYEEILDRTMFLDEKSLKISLLERLYCLKNNIKSNQYCKNCNKGFVKFYTHLNAYADYCCISCASSSEDAKTKSKATRLKKYGKETYINSEKAKETRYKRNNGKFHSSNFAEKVKATKKKHFGDENFTNVEKAKQTKIQRYGTASYNNYDKIQQTKFERYSDANWNNREKFKRSLDEKTTEDWKKIKEKRKRTNKLVYGFEYATQAEQTKKKTQHTCIEKYGVKTVFNTQKARKNMIKAKRLKSWEFIIEHSSEYTPLFTQEEFLNRSENDKLKWRCNKCGTEFEVPYYFSLDRLCEKCWPRIKMGISLEELEVADYLKSICGDDKVFNSSKENRDVLDKGEIDIVIPSLKLGIEFDGLFWHSGTNKGKNYHLNKTEQCEKNGWQLIHIFEDEWLDKKQIVKSRLKHLVSKNGRKIFARKCVVKEIDTNVKNAFLDKYHLQGTAVSKINLGLFYNNHLVAVMTFVKPRYSAKYQYELQRYATVFNFTIVGGASKLLKYFERNYNPTSIISYADRRWSTGNLYKQIGFTLDHVSKPSYFYVKYGNRYSRIMFQKHKLPKLLDKFDTNMSEIQNMVENGYRLIFDCGNLVFVKMYN